MIPRPLSFDSRAPFAEQLWHEHCQSSSTSSSSSSVWSSSSAWYSVSSPPQQLSHQCQHGQYETLCLFLLPQFRMRFLRLFNTFFCAVLDILLIGLASGIAFGANLPHAHLGMSSFESAWAGQKRKDIERTRSNFAQAESFCSVHFGNRFAFVLIFAFCFFFDHLQLFSFISFCFLPFLVSSSFFSCSVWSKKTWTGVPRSEHPVLKAYRVLFKTHLFGSSNISGLHRSISILTSGSLRKTQNRRIFMRTGRAPKIC